MYLLISLKKNESDGCCVMRNVVNEMCVRVCLKEERVCVRVCVRERGADCSISNETVDADFIKQNQSHEILLMKFINAML